MTSQVLSDSQRLYWSGMMLPYMEQTNLSYTIDPNQAWDVFEPNIRAMQSLLPLFRCPSSNAPDVFSQMVDNRATSTYLACASGLVRNETGTGTLISDTKLDGMLYTNSRIQHRDITDGLSNTMLIGESLFLPGVNGPDNEGNPQIIDHWCVGSPGMGRSEMSEALGTTAIAINTWKQSPLAFIEDIELGYSSRHAGLILAVFADGHVQSISESVDKANWSAAGTRGGSEVTSVD